jgi:hypothetical protein
MLNKEEKKQLREDYSKYSNPELMEKYHLSLYTLKQFVIAEGLELKKHRPLTTEQRQYILDNPLKSHSVLAEELDVTYIMVALVRRKHKKH